MSSRKKGPPQQTNKARFGHTSPLRSHPLRYFVVFILLVWITYCCSSGFRNPFQPITLSDGNKGSAIRQALFGFGAILSLTTLYFTRNLGTVLTMNRGMLLLSILVPASLLWSAEPKLTIKRSILFLFGLIILYTITYSSRQPVRKMLLTIVGSTSAVAFISLLIHFAFSGAYTVNPARPGLAGITQHPNSLSPMLSIGLILSLGISFYTTSLKILGRLAQGLMGLCLLLAQSMTSLMATTVGCGLFVILSSARYQRGAMHLLIASVFTLCSIIGWSNIKSGLFQATGRDESLSGRDEVWKIIINEAIKRPIFGRGYGAFWTEGKGRELVQTWNPRQSHNAYLDLWLDLGIIGIVIFVLNYHILLFRRWLSIRGSPGSAQRKAMSALYATSITYLIIYALGESFFLKVDNFVFMTVTWIMLLLGNPDVNCIENEFANVDARRS
jgi:exopolysaccharide production protein ExoQ